MSTNDKDKVFFVVWVLNKAAQAWEKTPSEVYRLLQEADIVSDYLMGFYDVAHTMGERAIIDDLEVLAARKGLAV